MGFCVVLALLGSSLEVGCSGAGAGDGAAGPSVTGNKSQVPTFTEIYDEILDETPAQSGSSCWGSNCHAPVPDPGVAIVDFSSRGRAYASLVPSLTGSFIGALTDDLDFLRMPKDRPRLSADLIARCTAWVDAGAPNN